jgi:hypothetical protein
VNVASLFERDGLRASRDCSISGINRNGVVYESKTRSRQRTLKVTGRAGPWIAGKEHVHAEDDLFISFQISDFHRGVKLGLGCEGGPSQRFMSERCNRISVLVCIARLVVRVVDFSEDDLSESNS